MRILVSILPLLLLLTAAAQEDWSAGKWRSQSDEALASGDYNQALVALMQSIQLEPDNAINYYKRYRVHLRKNNKQAALQDINAAIGILQQVSEKSKKSLSDYIKNKVQLLVQLGQCQEAVTELQQQQQYTSNIDGSSAHACSSAIVAAKAASDAHQYEKALEYYTTALQYASANTDLLYQRALAYYNTNDYYGTIADTGLLLKQASSTTELTISAYCLRGNAYQRLYEHESAILHYREGLKLDPEHAECKSGHRLVKKLDKANKKGQDAFDKADYATAVDTWNKALDIDTTHRHYIRPLQLKLVQAYTKNNQHVQAMQLAEQYISDEKTLSGVYALADAQLGADQYQQAVNTLQEAVNMADSNEDKQHAQDKLRQAQTALKQSKEKNYYKILGVSRDATTKEIKSAYRKLALQWHPDKAEDKEQAEKMFQDIGEAYEVLSTDDLKQKYDRGEDVFDNQGGGRHDPYAHFRQTFHQSGGFGGGRQRVHVRYG